MATSTAKIQRNRGDTTAFTVTIEEPNGTLVDVTGYSFIFTVDPSKAPAAGGGELYSLSVGSGITISDGPNGEITIGMSVSDSDQTPGDYFYDLQMTDLGSLITTILKGDYEVIQDITK